MFFKANPNEGWLFSFSERHGECIVETKLVFRCQIDSGATLLTISLLGFKTSELSPSCDCLQNAIVQADIVAI